MHREYPTCRAVALTSTGVAYGDGRTPRELPDINRAPLAVVLAGSTHAFGQGGDGVAVIYGQTREHLADQSVPGWDRIGDTIRPWTEYRHPATGTVVRVALADDPEQRCPLIDTDPQATAARLDRYHVLTGGPFFGTPGLSGIVALRGRHTREGRGAQPLWQHEPARGVRGAGPLVWSRPLPDDAIGYVHVFDVNAMYLAAMRSAHVAWGRLEHTGECPFDDKAPGYWHIALSHVPAELVDGRDRPPVMPAGSGGAVWVTTEVMKYLMQRGVRPDVLDSWTSTNRQEIMRAYAERLMSARLGMLGPVPADVLPVIKGTYTQTVGMLGRAGSRIYRPDWQHTIMDLARMNLLRRLDRVADRLNLWPYAVRTDAAYYLWPSPDPNGVGVALGTGTGAGTFKYVETLTVGEYRSRMTRKAHV